jgi:hypothetical protein
MSLSFGEVEKMPTQSNGRSEDEDGRRVAVKIEKYDGESLI